MKRISLGLLLVGLLTATLWWWVGTQKSEVDTKKGRTWQSVIASPAESSKETSEIPDLTSMELGDLIAADAPDASVAIELIRRLPEAKGTGYQYELTSHLANVIEEEDYDQVTAVILAHEDLESAALDVLLADLHLRDATIKLPTLAKISEDPEHPAYREAFSSLRTYFEDAGDGLNAWREAAYAYGEGR